MKTGPLGGAVRLAVLVLVELAAALVLVVLVATVIIPLSAPASIPSRPGLPLGVVFACPPRLPGCR